MRLIVSLIVLAVCSTSALGEVGACCWQGDCYMVEQGECEAAGGQWAGGACDEVDCGGGGEEGACCIGDMCHMLTGKYCVWKGGKWYGPGSSCDQDDIECGGSHIGACCINGGCLMLNEDQCKHVQGVYHPNMGCDGVDCTWCVGDLNGDGEVAVDDLLMLLAAWGPCP